MAEVSPASVSTMTPPSVQTGDDALDAILLRAWEGMPDRPDHLVEHAQRALDRADSTDNARGRAYALGVLGTGLYMRSDHEEALEALTEGLALIEPFGDLYGRGLLLGGLAGVHVSLGHFDEAMETALDALRVARVLGDREREAWTLVGLGNSYLDLGDLERAMEAGETGLRLFGELGQPAGQARAHGVMGGALMRMGRSAEARAHHEAALRLAREDGVRLNEARALHDLGECAYLAKEYAQALQLHREALGIRREVGNRQAQSTSLLHIGLALTALGRAPEAIETLVNARDLAMEVGAEPRIAQADEALADAYEASGDAARALEHFRLFHARRERMLDAQSRSRIQSIQIRADAEQAQREAEIAHLRSVELADANAGLEEALTDLQQTQRRLLQQEKLASLGRLASGVAHEIQNPINFIANFAEINADYADEMRETVERRRAELPPDLADELTDLLGDVSANTGRVREHAQRASGIVKSLIGHGNTSSGQRETVDLRDLVGRVVDVTFAGSGIRPVWVPGAEPVHAEVDAQAFDRALVNLVDNARRAVLDRAHEDDGFRAVVCVALDRVDDRVILRVMDNGPGIPDDLRDRVFEPFFSTRPTGEGTGLGLTLARQIVVDGHEGSLDLEPSAMGSTFTISLPSADA
ncbi:tetratricopeptide repeat protein [Rubricoccus marinus]|uniref:histidine kinase n=1 Tax=Rubricoccus marinus TaxID=716817 RepID=A0A259TWF0_9BACT|nr:tetratricopeptide repeat protein [Rubricoccus marinus]OZC02020.1 hypothetical protein BSZ36_02905 [Rubricoccus marinus]